MRALARQWPLLSRLLPGLSPEAATSRLRSDSVPGTPTAAAPTILSPPATLSRAAGLRVQAWDSDLYEGHPARDEDGRETALLCTK